MVWDADSANYCVLCVDGLINGARLSPPKRRDCVIYPYSLLPEVLKGGMNGSACTVPVPYIAMAARSAVRVQLYGNSTTSTEFSEFRICMRACMTAILHVPYIASLLTGRSTSVRREYGRSYYSQRWMARPISLSYVEFCRGVSRRNASCGSLATLVTSSSVSSCLSRAPSPLPLDTSLLVARIGRIGLDAGGKPRKTGSGLGRPSSLLLLLLVSLSMLSLRPGLRQALPVRSVSR